MATGKYRKLFENTGLMFVGSFGSKIISFVMLPFYTMWLSVEDYGTSDMINVCATVLMAIVSLSIGDAIFVIPSQKSKKEQTSYFTSSLFFSILCIFALALLYLVVSLLFSSSESVFFTNILYICLITGTTLYTTIFQQFCKSIDKVKVFAFAGIIQTISVAGLGFLVIPTYKLDGYIWCILVANVITIVFLFICAGLYKYISIESFSVESLKEMFRYSIPLIPNSVIWLIVSYLNRPIMETSLGLYALGIFSLANRFPTLINTVYNTFSNSWQISILEQYGKEGFSSFYNKVSLVAFIAMSIFISLFALVTKPLVVFFLDSNYYESINYIPLLCLSCLFVSLGSMVGAIFSAVRQSKYFFYSSVWSAISAILLNYILINHFGIYGACWACVISYLVGGFSRIIYATKYNTFTYIKQILVISILTTCVVCIMSYIRSFLWGILFTLLLLVYILIVAKQINLISFVVGKIKRK